MTNRTTQLNRRSRAFVLLFAVFLSVTWVVFPFCELFFTNANDLWFPLGQVVALPVALALGVAALAYIRLLRLSDRAYLWGTGRLLGARVGFYLQGNVVASFYGILDGSTTAPGLGMHLGSVVVWVGCIAGSFALPLLGVTIIERVRFYVTVFLLTVQVATLGVLIAHSERVDASFGQNYYSDAGQFTVSRRGNILVFVADTFEAKYLEAALRAEPSIKDALADFTFYENTTGTSTLTYSSMAMLLTGQQLGVGMDYNRAIDECFRQSDFYSRLRAFRHTPYVYTLGDKVSPSHLGKIENQRDGRIEYDNAIRARLAGLLFKLVGYRYAPTFLREVFELDPEAFVRAYEEILPEVYSTNNFRFFAALKAMGVEAVDSDRTYKIYHFSGMHAPYVIDRNLNPVQYPANVPLEARRLEAALASLRIFTEYLAALKQAGAYENSSIFFTADHGLTNRYHPVLLVKEAGARRPFTRSNAPISLAEDFVPTILALAGNSGPAGSIFGVSADQQRDRRVYYYNWNYRQVVSKTVLSTTGHAAAEDGYRVLSTDFGSAPRPAGRYEFGTEIQSSGGGVVLRAIGFTDNLFRARSRIETLSRSAQVDVSLARRPERDVQVIFELGEVFYRDQRVVVSVAGTVIHDQSVPLGSGSFSFVIPATLAQDDRILLEIELPNAVKSRVDDVVGNEALYRALGIRSIVMRETEG